MDPSWESCVKKVAKTATLQFPGQPEPPTSLPGEAI